MTDKRIIKLDLPPEPPEKSIVLCLANGLGYQRANQWHPMLSFESSSLTWPMLLAQGELIVLTAQDDLDRIRPKLDARTQVVADRLAGLNAKYSKE